MGDVGVRFKYMLGDWGNGNVGCDKGSCVEKYFVVLD